MTLYINGHDYHYEMENICRLFFPYEKINVTYEQPEGDIIIKTELHQKGEDICISAEYIQNENVISSEMNIRRVPHIYGYVDETERQMAVLLYILLVKVCGFIPKWGILTGVRPVKLLRKLIDQAGSEQQALDYFCSNMLVSPEKANLALSTLKAENEILALNRANSFSLYISIPFCPTRCSYCSFVSQSIEQATHLIPGYMTVLIEELRATAQIVKDLGLRLETVYIGGGTPTTLSAGQLQALLSAVNAEFDTGTLREFTVEAGRPDTIDAEKLAVLKAGGVTRISINPQTMNDAILTAIGRKHTAKQIVAAVRMTREAGFDHINMDLIAGLPNDTAEGFQHTLYQTLAFCPESITIHTLSLKRAANMSAEKREELKRQCNEADKMLILASEMLYTKQYQPYYLYRQSRTLGNLENIGWSKKGYEGIYNVLIMDESQTVLAVGAGAVSKLKQFGGNALERIFNYKFPYEYNNRLEETLKRKKKVYEFYERFLGDDQSFRYYQ